MSDLISRQDIKYHTQLEDEIPTNNKSVGEWIKSRTDGYVYCSNCNRMQDKFHAIWHKWRFCPHCGARMKGADDDL